MLLWIKRRHLIESQERVRWVLRKLGVDEWLIRTVMALYTETCTVVRTDAGKEHRQTLFSAQYIQNGFTNGAVVYVVTFRR